jgi:hypothetical protein
MATPPPPPMLMPSRRPCFHKLNRKGQVRICQARPFQKSHRVYTVLGLEEENLNVSWLLTSQLKAFVRNVFTCIFQIVVFLSSVGVLLSSLPTCTLARTVKFAHDVARTIPNRTLTTAARAILAKF